MTPAISLRRRGHVARAVLAAVVATALVAIGWPIPSALADTGAASGLTLKVLADGTANSDGSWDSSDDPGYDSSPNNGIVRTHDYVVYQWGYSVVTAGDVTLTQTLPAGMSWVVGESVASCAEGAGAVSADGRTITCTRANQATGASTYQVKAKVDYGSNGQVLSTVLSSAGASDSTAAPVTVSAAPKFNLSTAVAAPYFANGGADGTEPGFNLVLRVMVYQPIDPIRGVRGGEALADGFSFTIDPSDGGDNIRSSYCPAQSTQAVVGNLNIYPSIQGGASTAANSIPNRGTWSCSQAVPGGPITVTVTGAITDVRSYPTVDTAGAALANASTRAQVTGNELALWIPSADVDVTRTIGLRVNDFDPVSVSGQSNYGGDYAPGQAPGAANLNEVNWVSTTVTTEEQLGLALSRVYGPDGTLTWNTPLADGASSVTAGDTPLARGATVRYGGYVKNSSGQGTTYTNSSFCAVWDESLLTVGDLSINGAIDPSTLEYAQLPVSTDAERKAVDCGVHGDGDAAWFSTAADAGGASVVNAVRFKIGTLPSGHSPYFAVAMTRTDADLAPHAVLPVFWQVRSDQTSLVQSTYNPASASAALGSRALALDTYATVDLSWDAASGKPGDTRTVTAQPVLTNALDTPSATDVSVAVVIPAGTSMVANSWPSQYNPSVVQNADGSATYTFTLGDVSGDSLPAITFDVNLSALLQIPTSVTASATISTTEDFRAAQFRTDTAVLAVNAPAAFSVNKTGSSTYAIPGVPVTYTVGWVNGLDESVGTGKIVDVLPFDGDGRGTTGLNGLTLTGVGISADMGVEVEYSTADPATAKAQVEADPSGDTVTGGWSAWPTDGSVPAGVTALRFLTEEIASGMAGEATITVVPGVLSLNGSITNDVYGVVSLMDQAVQGVSALELISGATQISGTVYQDEDYSWALDAGDTGLAGVTVRVTGHTFGADGIDDGGAGDDVVVTTADNVAVSTAADGSYTLDGLAPGNWTVAVDPSSAALAGLTAAQAPAQSFMLNPTDVVTGVDFGFIEPVAAPALVDDAMRVSAGDTVQIAVLANDVLDASASIVEVSSPATGTVTWLTGDTQVGYTAAADGSGDVTFTYTVQDKARQRATATVTVTVVPLPTAGPLTGTVGQGATTLTGLAELITGDEVAITAVSAASNGTATLTGGQVVYTPTAGFSGTETFTYTVTDSMGKTATATVTLRVLAAPIAVDDTAWTLKDTAVEIVVLGNDTVDGAVTVTSAGGEVSAEGVLTYTPAAGFTGTDAVTYTVTDTAGQTATATVTITVVEGMLLAPDTARTGMETAVQIPVLANDVATDPTVTGLTVPAHGTATVAADGVVTYTPEADFVGTDTFTYTVTDAAERTATGTVTVTVLARPTAEDLDLLTGVNRAVTGSPLATGDQPTAAVSAQGAHGTAVLDADGTLTYTPDAGYLGTDQVTLLWTDSVGQTVSATVTVTVIDAPVANDDTAWTLAGNAVTTDVLANDQGDTLALTDVRRPMFGTAEIVDGELVYTPNAGYSGVDAVVYTATDRAGQTVEATLRVSVYATPVAPDLTARIPVDAGLVLDPAGTPVDTGDALLAPWTVTAVGSTEAGEVVLDPDGTLTFTPVAGFVGTATFGYTVTDDLGQTAEATVTIEVIALTVQDVQVGTAHDTAVSIDLLASVTGSGVQITEIGAAGHGTVTRAADGTLTYIPTAGFAGTDTFTVTVTDDLGQVATLTVTVTVDPATPGVEGGDGSGDTTTPAVRSGVLAVTGAQAGSALLIALLALAGGWWLLVLARRRRQNDEA